MLLIENFPSKILVFNMNKIRVRTKRKNEVTDHDLIPNETRPELSRPKGGNMTRRSESCQLLGLHNFFYQ